ncbi:Epoxide hydrolase 4 [Orchesella cincta]|uniref:Epoxide hydrolase 4 n=1 Tax=Orchesella cincta TaxID=48709 RepID=A0A1D2NG08_ORCCI|nr:Epoxide hydrolase 4 [Orchesella cincta]
MKLLEFVKQKVLEVAARAAVLAIGLFYAAIAVVNLVFKRLRYGSDFLKVKERSLPPLCLQDTAYGRHAFLRLKDLKIHYVENGDRSKPLMLFVHGFPEFWFSWRHQLKHFSSTHWVVAMDMRGYGDSDKPTSIAEYKIENLVKDVCELIKALGRNKCTLVAHDWGGVVAWAVAAHFPDMVRFHVSNSLHPEILFHTEDLACFKRMFGGVDNKMNVSEEDLEGYKYTFSRKGAWSPPINYYRCALSGKAILAPAPLPTITVPTLMIWGENDVALDKELPELTREFCE